MSQSEVHVRRAEKGDLREILALVNELAVFEKAADQVMADISTYESAFADDCFQAIVAQVNSEIVGMALYYHTFSTWRGRMMYLEDLIVRDDMRNRGIGRRLVDRFIEEAKAAGAVMCKWQVLDWNADAIRFYKRYPVMFDYSWIDVKMYFDRTPEDTHAG
jgi:GNAT superfamily N-acetyltransferase